MTDRIQEVVCFRTLDDLESYIAENWIYPVGTNEAQRHVRAKLSEEIAELGHALAEGSEEDIKSEMGDVLWTTGAVAMNEGYSLEEIFRNSPLAALLPEGTFALDYVDAIARSADIEWDVPVILGLYGLEAERLKRGVASGDIRMTQLVLKSLGHQLGKSARMTRVLSDAAEPWVSLHGHRVEDALTQIVLLISYIAQTYLGSSLAEVMSHNRAKLADRLAKRLPVTRLPAP